MRSILAFLLLAALALPAAAQQKPDVKGGTIVGSEPGRAAAVRAAEISAQVVSLDKKNRTIGLKGPKGRVQELVVSDEVKNFDQIKVGDFVMVRFMQSLGLELQKAKSGATGISVSEGAIKAQPGQRPAVGAAREITAIAKVTAVDPKASTISMVGPRGNVVTFPVENKDHFKVVKVGDEVLVTYTEAVAVSVEPGKKPAAKKDAKK
jgi:hypothetical protein